MDPAVAIPPEAQAYVAPHGPGALASFSDAEIILMAAICGGYTAEELSSPTSHRLFQEVLYQMHRRNIDSLRYTVNLAERCNAALAQAHQAELARRNGKAKA